MKPRTTEQNKRLHAILAKHDLVADKATYAFEASGGRTSKTSELYYNECETLINGLTQNANAWHNDPLNKTRRKVFSLCYDLGWIDGRGNVDQKILNNWLLSERCKAKKLLNDQNKEELSITITQLEQILKSDYANC